MSTFRAKLFTNAEKVGIRSRRISRDAFESSKRLHIRYPGRESQGDAPDQQVFQIGAIIRRPFAKTELTFRQMIVHVSQTGYDKFASRIDYLRASRHFHRARRADLSDMRSFDDDNCIIY